MHKIILILALAFCFLELKTLAQSDISMSTHWYNRASYNPASIVKPDYYYLFSNARKQWTGISGSPLIFNVQASVYNEEIRSGFGISLINDNIGLTHVFNPTFLYAHRVALNDQLYLSLGLSFGAFIRTVNASLFEAETIIDPALDYVDELNTRPDANVGFEFQGRYFFLGASTTHLFSINKTHNTLLNTNHRYAYVYYKNSDNDLFNVLIGTQVINRYNLNVYEGHAMIRFKYPTGLLKGPRELFDIGCSWRSTNQMTLLLGINITADLRAGYAYDYDFDLPKDKKGSHELVIEYRLPALSKNSCPGTNWYF